MIWQALKRWTKSQTLQFWVSGLIFTIAFFLDEIFGLEIVFLYNSFFFLFLFWIEGNKTIKITTREPENCVCKCSFEEVCYFLKKT